MSAWRVPRDLLAPLPTQPCFQLGSGHALSPSGWLLEPVARPERCPDGRALPRAGPLSRAARLGHGASIPPAGGGRPSGGFSRSQEQGQPVVRVRLG